MEAIDRFVDVGVRLHIREWIPPAGMASGAAPFLLVHGLASNARTWDAVARILVLAGHPVVAVDQRGHGLSDKPDDGYDFATVAADLRRLIETLGWSRPVLAGQSWGGNVALAFGAHYPGLAGQLIFVDGGFLALQQRAPWEQVAAELRPPPLAGTPRAALAQRLRTAYPHWPDEGIEATLGNFETLPDGTVRPWLTLERHMRILRALYDQRPAELFPLVQEPVLICVADDGSEWSPRKRAQVAAAQQGLRRATVAWFPGAAHDIHVDRPGELAQVFQAALATG